MQFLLIMGHEIRVLVSPNPHVQTH